MATSPTYRVLSIDAWRYDGGWQWNQWYLAGHVYRHDIDGQSNRHILRVLREAGMLSQQSAGRLRIEDDQYNLVVCDRSNGEPVCAIEYGSER